MREADQIFQQSYDKYQAAVRIKPDYHEALNNWAWALGDHGAMPHMAERATEMFALAKKKALAAEKIKPGSGAYNVACACARLGEEDECRRWLETALEHAGLESRSHMEKDHDFDTVRDTDWFKAILEKAPAG